MNIAFFDFDGTITSADTYSKFIFYSSSKMRLLLGLLFVFPIIFLYKVGLLSATKTRAILTKIAFFNRSEARVLETAQVYATSVLPSVIRKEAMQKIKWHQARGDQVVVVSASLDVYLSYWCDLHGVKLICSELQRNGAKFTGNYVNGDCCGDNKVRLIQRYCDLSKYESVFAYGDTDEDLPMLSLANVKYYQWQEVVD